MKKFPKVGEEEDRGARRWNPRKIFIVKEEREEKNTWRRRKVRRGEMGGWEEEDGRLGDCERRKVGSLGKSEGWGEDGRSVFVEKTEGWEVGGWKQPEDLAS